MPFSFPGESWIEESPQRLKGIIHAEDQPAPLAIHAVHSTLYPPTLLKGWDKVEPSTRVVLIGKGLVNPRYAIRYCRSELGICLY